MRYIVLVFLAFSNLQLAFGSLYPTHPDARSNPTSGTNMTVTWTDSRHPPHIRDMGPMDIDLCAPNGTRCHPLATGVSPTQRACSVLIPQNVSFTGTSKFVMLFTCSYPIMTIWTHSFHITPGPSTTDSILPYMSDDNATNPELTLVLQATTVVSELAPTPKVPAATTISAGPLNDQSGGAGLDRVHSPNSANPRKESREAQYRLAFILWPALIGISMAL
ncbi:hypothetical protein C8R47DRAFT_1111953 [Mycena vitilis]|nr:hypothetical protein C8R47DRAFT_1111953 [Mycena vitilis]